MEAEDLTGKTFGRLTVIKFDCVYSSGRSKSKKRKWLCKCACGKTISVVTHDLKNNHTNSCGCYQREQTSRALRIHGMRHTKIYHVWLDMKQRCQNPNNSRYANYGGRGIQVYNKWNEDFSVFLEYVSELPHYAEKGFTIDRIDVNGNYEPGNIRWTDMMTQASNKTSNHYITDTDGESLTIAEYARKYGMNYNRAYYLMVTKKNNSTKGEQNGIKNQPISNTRSSEL